MVRTSDVGRSTMSAFEAGDTLATVTLDFGGPLLRPEAAPGDGAAARGRHTRLPAEAGWIENRAVPLFHRYKRVFLAGVTALVLVLIGISFAGGERSPGTPCAPPYPGKQASDVCGDINGRLTIDDVTVRATPLTAAGGRVAALTLCSTVTLTNGGGDTKDYRVADFTIQNPSGGTNAPTSGTLTTNGTLAPGGTRTGTICDDRAVWSGQYAVLYQPGGSDEVRGVWLSQR